MLSDEYIAGFFDGEGSVTITQGSRTVGDKVYDRADLWVSVSQLRPDVLYRIYDRFGGKVYERKVRATASGLTHRRWDWVVTSLAGAKFLRVIHPHCIVKGTEIRIALEFYRTFELIKELRLGTKNGTPPELKRIREQCIAAMKAERARTKAYSYGIDNPEDEANEVV